MGTRFDIESSLVTRVTRATRLAVLVTLAALALLPGVGCVNEPGAPAEAGSSDAAPALDLCDAFTGAGTSCPLASPLVCFPYCDGGCSCGVTAGGPKWACVTDLSCTPACSPIDALDAACLLDEASVDGGSD
jgi:hypothetical protein